jgi:hypothetical protein
MAEQENADLKVGATKRAVALTFRSARWKTKESADLKVGPTKRAVALTFSSARWKAKKVPT